MSERDTYNKVQQNLRTPGELVIKTIATHIFAAGNYAYMSTLQQRPTRTGLHAIWVAIFVFVPAIVIIEVLSSVFYALYKFIRNQIDDEEEEKNIWFHLSASLGMYASIPITDQITKKDETHYVPLLKLDPSLSDRKRIGWSWSWGGKMFGTLFALTQAVGTIVMYARRLIIARAVGLDHRNGAMGVASTICSVVSILILLLRYKWSAKRVLQSSATEALHLHWTSLSSRLFWAMTLYAIIMNMTSDGNRWMYSSSGVFLFLSGIMELDRYGSMVASWQTILLAIVLFIFRRDIPARLGADSTRYQSFIRSTSWKRAKALAKVCFAIWLLGDVVQWFIRDIINVVTSRDDYWCWWQDPISDKLFVV